MFDTEKQIRESEFTVGDEPGFVVCNACNYPTKNWTSVDVEGWIFPVCSDWNGRPCDDTL